MVPRPHPVHPAPAGKMVGVAVHEGRPSEAPTAQVVLAAQLSTGSGEPPSLQYS